MKSVYLLCASLLFIGNCTTSAPRRPAGEATLDVRGDLDADLATVTAAVRRRLFDLDRDLATYHYEKESESNFKPTSLRAAQARISGWTENFYDVTFTKGMSYEFGPGEYVAVDPFSSRDLYGDATPQLYAFELARGARVFNSTLPYDAREKAALEDIFNRRRCIGTTTVYPEDIFSLLGDMRRSMVDDCMRLVVRAFQDLNVDAVLYEFPAANTIAGCRAARGGALVVVRNRAIRFDRFGYYDNDQKFESAPLGAEIAALYAEASRDQSFDFGGLAKLRPPASLPAPTRAPGYSRWKADHVYMCGAPSALDLAGEKQNLAGRFFTTYRDSDATAAFTRLRDAFFSRFPNRAFRLSRLRGLEKLTRAANERPVDARAWTAALDLGVDAETPDQLRQTAARLGESYSGGPFSFASFVKTIVLESPAGLATLGFGPNLARLKLNSLLLQFGGVPSLGGRLFGSATENRARSKTLYLDLLARCAARYLDAKTSNDAVDGSECGFRDPKE